MKTLLMSVMFAALAGPALAATWIADPGASKVGFSGSQTGQPFQGSFKTFSATISFDPARPGDGSADVAIDTASAATGDAQRDAALPQPEWFDAGKFPRATFHVGGFEPRGGDQYVAKGTLTIRGVSAEVTLPFRLSIDGDTARATGHADLVRTSFGVGQGDWATAEYVALEVGVDIDLVARRAK